jgi:formylglycine-generating enzyme
MKTKLIFLLLILTGLLISQTEKGISIKSKAGNEGKRWAICVGINNYEYDGISKLKKAQNDAEALGDAFKTIGQFDHVFVLTDKKDPRSKEYPTASKLRNQLNFMQNFLEPNDLVVFAFSGHGVSDDKGNGYLLTADTDPKNIFGTSVKIKEVTDVLKKTGVKKSLLLVDACREEFQENKGINNAGLRAEKFEQSEVAAAFYATKAGGFSYEDDKSDYGAFTKYVLKGLGGDADITQDGIVTFSELKSFVEDEVTNWAIEKGKVQKPYTKLYSETYGDLALSSYKGVQPSRKYTSSSGSSDGNMIFVQGGSNGDFYIGKTEVTQAQWKAVMGNNPSSFKGDNLPVETVSWFDAVDFCNKLSEMEGLTKCYSGSGNNLSCNFKASGYRLPTEAEWEYAAKGGNQSKGYTYSGSNNVDEVAWYDKNSYDKGKNHPDYGTHQVATKKPNELGIHDMSGNVWEWCWDWYTEGKTRVLRGGSWGFGNDHCEVAYRNDSIPDDRLGNFGFRVARTY